MAEFIRKDSTMSEAFFLVFGILTTVQLMFSKLTTALLMLKY